MATDKTQPARDPRSDKADETVRRDARLAEFERLIQFPDDLRDQIETEFDDLRTYVHTDALVADDEDCVNANFILRGQYAVLAQVAPKDPKPEVVPFKQVGNLYTPDLLRYAETHEALCMRQMHHSRMKQVIEGALQDAQTVPFTWLKVRFQHNPSLDELGYPRHNDQLDTLARFQWLKTKEEEGDIFEGSAEEAELRELEITVRQVVMEQLADDLAANPPNPLLDEYGEPVVDRMTGEPLLEPDDRLNQLENLKMEMPIGLDDLPEIGIYKGWVIEQVDAEDIRWDWSIRRYEDLYAARWMAHRVFMYPRDVSEKFGIDEAELLAATQFDEQGKVVLEPSNTAEDFKKTGDVEQGSMGRRIAVWELHHRVLGKTFVWVQGMDDFLAEYVSPARGRRFFPFFLVQMQSRVSGRFVGRSPTELQRPLQEEMNMLRTHGLEARKSAHPRYVVTKNTLKPAEMDELSRALPYSVTEIEKAQDIKNHLHELTPSKFDDRLYSRADTFIDWQSMAGIPMAALGGVGAAQLATEAAIANEQMGAQSDMRSVAIQELYSDIFEYQMQVNAQMFDQADVQARVGPAGFWPEFESRSKLLENFAVKCRAELNTHQEKKARLEEWQIAVQTLGGIGNLINPIGAGAEMLDILDTRRPLETYIMAPDQAAALNAGGGGEDPGNTPPGENPEEQGAEGEGGGRPPMDDAPPPEDVSNSPTAPQ